MALASTSPRQVRLLGCIAYTPGMETRDAPNGVDVSAYVSEINIFESVFNNTISGKIVFSDTIGLPEYLPLVGVEFLLISFSVTIGEETELFQRIFSVVGLHDQTFEKNELRLFTLDIVTPEFVKSVSQRIQKSYNQTTCSEAIRSVLVEELGVKPDGLKDISPTHQRMSVTIPNYTALGTISYFTMLALDPAMTSCYMFFETLQGYHFASLETMYSAAPVREFDINTGQVSTQKHISDTDAFNSIIRLHQEQAFSLLNDITGGVLRSRVLHLDFFARKYRFEDSSYTDSFQAAPHLDGGEKARPARPLYPANFDTAISPNVKLFVVPSTAWSKDSKYIAKAQDAIDEELLHKSIILRNRQLKTLKHIKTVIELPGQAGVRAGATVVVNYPSTRPLENNTQSSSIPIPSQPSPYYSGKHLVTAVRHILTRESAMGMRYMMHIEVCRDALSGPLPTYPIVKDA